jgi:hypothetical protein
MPHTHLHRNRNRGLAFGCIWIAALILFAPAAAQGSGDCLQAEVPTPMVLPDGSEHPAGSLRICMSKNYSPVSGLHKTSVDGRVIGLFRSRQGVSEAEFTGRNDPFVLFHRGENDHLVLVGFAWPSGERLQTYRMNLDRKAMPQRIAGKNGGPPEMILLAALIR